MHYGLPEELILSVSQATQVCASFLFIKNEVDAPSLLTNRTLTFTSDFGLLRLSDEVLVLVRKHEITVSVTGFNTNFTGSSVKRHSKEVY